MQAGDNVDVHSKMSETLFFLSLPQGSDGVAADSKRCGGEHDDIYLLSLMQLTGTRATAVLGQAALVVHNLNLFFAVLAVPANACPSIKGPYHHFAPHHPYSCASHFFHHVLQNAAHTCTPSAAGADRDVAAGEVRGRCR